MYFNFNKVKTILITGGTGLVGSALTEKLLSHGYNVSHLSRYKRESSPVVTYVWDIQKEYIEEGAIETADCIIHLAGAGIADKRWTKKRKQEIIDSRVKSAELIFERVKALDKKPQVFISASGVGYYGAVTSKIVFTEDYPPASDFLGETCRLWEEAADHFINLGIRTVKLRTAVVLARNEGALKKLAAPIRWNVGAPLGRGDQYVPWIHIDDLCNAYIMAMEEVSFMGAYNAASPYPATNDRLTRKIAQILKKPLVLPNVPAPVLRLLLGEMAVMLLEGSRVSVEKLKSRGFRFEHPNLHESLLHLLK